MNKIKKKIDICGFILNNLFLLLFFLKKKEKRVLFEHKILKRIAMLELVFGFNKRED